MTEPRWPGGVYDGGEEPDYRWSFANERTFLAWIRTSLALVAGGVALDAIQLSLPEGVRRTAAIVLLVLGAGCAVVAWPRWAAAERAMRWRQPLPGARPTAVLAGLVALAALVLLAGVVVIAL